MPPFHGRSAPAGVRQGSESSSAGSTKLAAALESPACRAAVGRWESEYHGHVEPAEILHTRYFVARFDRRSRIVHLWRSPEPFPTLDEARDGWLSVVEALNRCGRSGRCLLADLRDGPARNDPEYEEMVRQIVPRVHAGFLRNAILVRMAVGALQIKRHAKGDGIERLITSSEAEALDYLKAVLPAPQQIMKK